MRQRIFQMLLVPHFIRTDQNSMIRTETPSLPDPIPILILPCRTPSANNVARMQIPVQRLDILLHEYDRRRVLEAPIPPLIALLAIRSLVADICCFAELMLPFCGHAPRKYVPVIAPFGCWVVACSRGIVRGCIRVCGGGFGGIICHCDGCEARRDPKKREFGRR